MSVKTNIAAIAAFVAVAAVSGLGSAQAHTQRSTAQHRVFTLPADAYGAVGSFEQVRPSQLTGGQGHDFQLEGRF
jgi:hypothetical protein